MGEGTLLFVIQPFTDCSFGGGIYEHEATDLDVNRFFVVDHRLLEGRHPFTFTVYCGDSSNITQ